MISPERLRLGIAIALFAVLGGAIVWVNHYPIAPRRPRPTLQTARGARPIGRAQIEGLVLGVDGKPAHADVSLVLESAPVPMRGGPIRGRRAAVTRTGDDGTFSFGAFGTGRYVVIARNTPGTPGINQANDLARLWASAEVDVEEAPPPNLRLTLRRSGGVSGRITFQRRSGPPSTSGAATTEAGLASTSISLEPVDADAKASILDGVPRMSPGGDGEFLIPDLPPGTYRLSVIVPSPWILDAVTVAGHDGLDLPFRVAPGANLRDARVTAVDTPTVLTGEALDPAGRPAPFALVFAFPSDPGARTAPRRSQATRTDVRGQFTIVGLPSGTYLVGSAPADTPDSWYSPRLFGLISEGATTVRLGAGASATALVGGGPK